MRLTLAALLVAGVSLHAQAPAVRTTEQDHREMMALLGIRSLRPGPSGNESAPNHANYDEAAANPFPVLPGLLVMTDGSAVTTVAQWQRRRLEIIDDFEREIYGRVPASVPKVTWRVLSTAREVVGSTPVVTKAIVGEVDNSAHPQITVSIRMTVVVPANARGPVPLLMMFGRVAPTPIPIPIPIPIAIPTPIPAGQDPPSRQQLIEAGWGYATIDPSSIQADNGAGLTLGIIGLTNKGQSRTPEQWGSLRAWAWGAARGLDYLETDSAVDARHVGIEGVSRYGKAALVTMAFEPRFAMGLIGSSGKGGATLHRRNFGEAVESLTGSGEYHWMAGNYIKYGASDGALGSMNAGALPVDSHQLIALAAPRLLFISYGIPEKGDARWLDQQGSWMATVAAQPAWQLLGAPTLGVSSDAPMPPVNAGLLDGRLAWRQHDGGHTDAPNVKHFIEWATPKIRSPGAVISPAARGPVFRQ